MKEITQVGKVKVETDGPTTEERYDFKVSSNGEVSRCMDILSPRNVPVTNFHNIIKNSNENLLFFSFSDRIKVR